MLNGYEQSILHDDLFFNAINNIKYRSEDIESSEKYENSFIDLGAVEILSSPNHQILSGRRGTGKSHIFEMLTIKLNNGNNHTLLIDCRILGSGNEFSIRNRPFDVRCIHFYKEFLSRIHNDISTYVEENSLQISDDSCQRVRNDLNHLSELILYPNKTVTRAKVKAANKKGYTSNNTNSLSVKTGNVGLDIFSGKQKLNENEKVVESEVSLDQSISFHQVSIILESITTLLNISYFIFIDEWSSIPSDIQPYFAEYIKRSIIVCKRITVKIALIRKDEIFIKKDNEKIGFERGSEITHVLNLDNFYSFNNDRNKISSYIATLLYKHILSECELEYFHKKNINDGASLLRAIFESETVFSDIAKASNGNARDAINIFTRCVIACRKERINKISKDVVCREIRSWYEDDKMVNLVPDSKKFLNILEDYVIREKQTYGFLINNLNRNELIDELYDFRVIHLLSESHTINGVENSRGKRYSVYLLDYGIYVTDAVSHRELTFFYKVEDEGVNLIKEFTGKFRFDDFIEFDSNTKIRGVFIDEIL